MSPLGECLQSHTLTEKQQHSYATAGVLRTPIFEEVSDYVYHREG